MDVDLLNFVGYFIAYLVLGFVFFYFIIFKKRGSNFVSTICLMIFIVSAGIGFMEAVHIGIINLFIMVIALWFSNIIIKMNKQDQMEQEKMKQKSELHYQKKMHRMNKDKGGHNK